MSSYQKYHQKIKERTGNKNPESGINTSIYVNHLSDKYEKQSLTVSLLKENV